MLPVIGIWTIISWIAKKLGVPLLYRLVLKFILGKLGDKFK